VSDPDPVPVLAVARAVFERILVEPTPADLWELQKDLLALGDERATPARAVARAFHACLRSLESKSASRSASRWGAVLGTAAVGTVGLRDLLGRQDVALEELLASGVPAALEVGSAIEGARAWEVEAQLVYDEFAWFLYGELWDLSSAERPEVPAAERRARIDELLDPLLDPAVTDADRAWLVVDVFRAVLAARMVSLLGRSATASKQA
jgi:hypothetical protein